MGLSFKKHGTQLPSDYSWSTWDFKMIVKLSVIPHARRFVAFTLMYAPRWVYKSALGPFVAWTVRMHVNLLLGTLSTFAASEESFITMDRKPTVEIGQPSEPVFKVSILSSLVALEPGNKLYKGP